jgi:membrane-bound ClpP family serine protease
LLWAANQFPVEWEGVRLNAMGMKTINIELGRESLGLGIAGISVWIIGLLK